MGRGFVEVPVIETPVVKKGDATPRSQANETKKDAKDKVPLLYGILLFIQSFCLLLCLGEGGPEACGVSQDRREERQ